MRNKIQNEPSFFFPVSALEFTTSSIMIGQFHSTMIARYINCDLLISFSPIQKQGRGKLNYHPIPFCFNSVRGSWGELNPSPLPAGGLAPHLSHCADRREGRGLCETETPPGPRSPRDALLGSLMGEVSSLLDARNSILLDKAFCLLPLDFFLLQNRMILYHSTRRP